MPYDRRNGARDIFVAANLPLEQVGLRVAEAMGLTMASVLVEEATPERDAATWQTEGRITVWRLAPGGALSVKVDILLFEGAIVFSRFAPLARRHGLTIAWQEDETDSTNADYTVAFPDGSVRRHGLSVAETDESFAVHLRPPLRSA